MSLLVLCLSFVCKGTFHLFRCYERLYLCWFYASTFFERVLSICSSALYVCAFVRFMFLLLFIVIVICPYEIFLWLTERGPFVPTKGVPKCLVDILKV